MKERGEASHHVGERKVSGTAAPAISSRKTGPPKNHLKFPSNSLIYLFSLWLPPYPPLIPLLISL